jgi:YggT family protein
MNAILDFSEYLINWALQFVIWIVVAYAILSWLVGFQVVNLRNRFVYQASRILESLARPILAPIQRLLPSMGGMDFSPLILIVVVAGIQRYLLPALFGWLHMLASPGGPGI